ncbi:hypothetical protein MQE36_12475 [Zhouia spongiae]|uniref:Uncharacterized protein n=1 Tax=Zhouia spongiae TaxID=2202721 RepID=A0ABY3YJ89_9FLAO|nr:hypothetical protein [Zhouia spongiae]UNY97897.1 hypothetical protein MQE36_12475 [Zhouia spongiae]
MKKRTLIVILLILLFSSGTVLGLFFYTDYNNHLPSSFIRLFPPHAISEVQKELKLPKEQYQFAGLTKHHIYLHQKGNPLSILEIDSNLHITDTINLQLPDSIKINLARTQLTVNDMGIFLTDGTKPMLIKGSIHDWKLKAIDLRNNYFNEAIPVDTYKLAVIKLVPEQGRRLGMLNINTLTTTLNPKALEEQVDGFFCTDGTIHYNSQLQKLVYTYYYRNQYIVMDKSLEVIARYNTIDTTTTANIKIREIKRNGQRSMASLPPIISRRSHSQGQWFFNHSPVRAKNEPQKQFQKNTVIDVYNLKKGVYKHSFYIRNIHGQSIKDYMIHGGQFMVLYSNALVKYELDENNLN